MASRTWRGFCAVAAVSRYTRRLSRTSSSRTGKSARIAVTSSAGVRSTLPPRQFLFHRLHQPLADGRDGNPVEHLAGKRLDEHVSCLAEADAARAQVEQRVVVELTDRRSMRALHVVGEDLELRLRVDLGVVGQEQRLVRLLRVGLLRVLPDDDLAVEHRARLAGQDALVELVAR